MDILQEKWQLWFDSLDVDKTGVLTSKTWTDAADVLIKGHSLTGDGAKRAREKMAELGQTVHGGEEATVTKEQFTQTLRQFFQKDKNQALSYITSVLRGLFEVMDTDNDSLLDEAAFTVMCTAFGHSEDTARAVFKILAKGQTQLSIDYCVQFWTDVWSTADKKKWDSILEVFH